MSAVGIVVNPWAGKDIRRLHAPVGHTPDWAKIGIVRRVAIAALEAGVDEVLVARDVGRIAARAVAGLDAVTLLDGPGTGSAIDSRRAARQFRDAGCGAVVCLGGDGTCRDVAIGWADAPLVPISTGTNNVFPTFVDGSSSGMAAGLVATGRVPIEHVGRPAKMLTIDIEWPAGGSERDIALVDVALIDDRHTGARAVVRPASLIAVVATIASPSTTGLSAIAGRVQPLGRSEPGAVAVHLDPSGTQPGARHVRVPLVPGSFDEVFVRDTSLICDGDMVTLAGPGVLAYDGERDRLLPSGARASVRVAAAGPRVIDVDRTLHCAVRQRFFDINTEAADGD